jgi:hypothetical protein
LGVIDVKQDEIKTFYLHEYGDEKFDSYLGQPMATKIKTLKRIMFDEEVIRLLRETECSVEYWIKLLAWVEFVRKDLFSASFLNRELKRRKILWVSPKLNEKADKVLRAIADGIKN